GRQVYAVDALGAVTATQYDGVGNVRARTRHAVPIGASAVSVSAIASAIHIDANDRSESFVHNGAGRVVLFTDALGKKESYSYDGLGRKPGFVNKNLGTWTYAYDGAGRMVEETSPLVELTSAVARDTAAVAVGAAVEASVVTQLSYDALG